jgi:3-oxoacyl-[acyl-carrier-protein] synthase III
VIYEHVSIDSVAHVDAPVRLSSSEIVRRLRPASDRLEIRVDLLLEEVAGIRERRIWIAPTRVSDAATMAAEKALAGSAVPLDRIGVLINTSVSRDFLEPSTASVVHAALGLADTCQNFDVSNACLGFLAGMDIAARMIEHGEIDYALIVDGEVSNELIDRTIDRLNGPDTTAYEFRAELASLTLGSAAVAMVLGHRRLLPNGHTFRGGVSRSATAFAHLCQGTMDRMVTDSVALLDEGLRLAGQTYRVASATLGWAGSDQPDEFAVHQVSRVHTEALIDVLALDPAKVLALYPDYGNIGPAAIPVVLSKLDRAGRLPKGQRVALMGIGSGLNCSMAEVIW